MNKEIESKKKEIERNLQVFYDDDEITIVYAPTDDELKNIIIGLLKEGPKELKEIHSVLDTVASETRIRAVLLELLYEGKVVKEEKRNVFRLVSPA